MPVAGKYLSVQIALKRRCLQAEAIAVIQKIKYSVFNKCLWRKLNLGWKSVLSSFRESLSWTHKNKVIVEMQI